MLSKLLVRSHPNATNDISLFAHISLVGIVVALPFTFFDTLPGNKEVQDNAEENIYNLKLFLLYLGNGMAYTTYNLMSFMVLMRVNIATHAVLNVFR